MTQATAPGKVILFGEHAVVYGRPAIAIPVTQVRARAIVEANEAGEETRLLAPDLGMELSLSQAPLENPLAAAIRQLQTATGLHPWPPLTVTVTSQIPIASGLGSGAAITAAIIRAAAHHLGLGHLATNEWISDLTYEVEKIHHGTPSGIDNTVVAFEQPVYFMRRQPQNLIEPFKVARPLRLLIADTGISSSTRVVVEDVRRRWQADAVRFEALFDGCGRIAEAARKAIEKGALAEVGRLMTENQALLREMTVSSPALDQLVTAALEADALGAKLSGAGRGGNIIALVTPETETAVGQALHAAGAYSLITTIVES